MAGNSWNGLKWLEGFELLEMAGIAGNGWKWLELTGNGWKYLKMTGFLTDLVYPGLF